MLIPTFSKHNGVCKPISFVSAQTHISHLAGTTELMECVRDTNGKVEECQLLSLPCVKQGYITLTCFLPLFAWFLIKKYPVCHLVYQWTCCQQTGRFCEGFLTGILNNTIRDQSTCQDHRWLYQIMAAPHSPCHFTAPKWATTEVCNAAQGREYSAPHKTHRPEASSICDG